MNNTPKTCLILDTRKVELIRMDGPALEVSVEGQSRQLFPLRRLSRIHVIGHLNSGFDALLICSEQNIPVAFFTLRGRLRCQLYHPLLENTLLSHWLDLVEFDSEVRGEYEQWLSNQSSNVIMAITNRMGYSERRHDFVENKLKSMAIRVFGDRGLKSAVDWVKGMMDAHLSQLFQSFGLTSRSRTTRRLHQDIAPIIGLLFLERLLEDAILGHLDTIDGRTMSLFYQRHVQTWEHLARRMLSQLLTRFELII